MGAKNKKAGRAVKRLLRKLAPYCAVMVVGASLGWFVYRLWPQNLQRSAYPSLPAPEVVRGRLVVPFTSGISSAEVAEYDDQVEAFLRFDYLRGRTGKDGVRMLLAAADKDGTPTYRIYVHGQDDLLRDIPRLAELEGRGLIPGYELKSWTESELAYRQQQSHIFEAAYNVPAVQKLESVDAFQLRPALAEFLLFKSQTDIRVLGETDAKPQPLTRVQAEQLAADIIAVAHFYSLPLDYFLGVGAMENNYMDANGDLHHAVWKKRAQRGDIVLKRRRKRVLVSDYSIGPWQITRETLRYAHELYRKDRRDYALLPERLRPPRELDVNAVSDAVLTTYAGLLLRDLLDRCGGNVQKAIGAYNGGVASPNADYAAGVTRVAEYARRVLEHAAVLNGRDPLGRTPVKKQAAKDEEERPWWMVDP